MARLDITYVLTRDDTGAVGFMSDQVWEVDGDNKIVINDVAYTMRSNVDTSAYDSGPVEYNEESNALVPRLSTLNGVAGYKDLKKKRISLVTKQRIYAATFEYPASSGKFWSLSAEAQSSWHARINAINAGFRDMANLATAQRTYFTVDDGDSHEFTTNQSIIDAYASALLVVENYLEANRGALAAVDVAETVAEVDTAVADYLAL